MTEPTGQLYVVHEGQIVALQGRTVESVMADFVALRIAHLRRMAELAEGWGGHMIHENEGHTDLHPNYAKTVSDGRRLIRFVEACNREITRLTQPR